MQFVAVYDTVVSHDRIIATWIEILSDPEYQAGALAEYGGGLSLEPYKKVSESAAWREDQETPWLLIRDVTVRDLKDSGQGVGGVLGFNIFQGLAFADDSDELMREAYRRNRAVEMMCRSAVKSGWDIFKGTNVRGRGKVFVTRQDFGETLAGRASYYRFPSVAVEIRLTEGA
jgi:hypothetical protein